MGIEMQPVESSNVESVGYDEDKLSLMVMFKGGALYEYKNVPPSVHQALIGSDSVGQYLNMMVKPQFEYERVG